MDKDTVKLLIKIVPLALVILGYVAFRVYVSWQMRGVHSALKAWRKEIEEKAHAGDPICQFTMGEHYLEGACNYPQDDAKAAEWFDKALPGLMRLADGGRGDAMFCLYQCYSKGLGVEKNEDTAFEWLRCAAEKEESDALYLMALEYREGGRVEKDEAQFIRLLQKAAADNGDAMYLLGACYEHGAGVERDLARAVELYEQADEELVDGAEEALERVKKQLKKKS